MGRTDSQFTKNISFGYTPQHRRNHPRKRFRTPPLSRIVVLTQVILGGGQEARDVTTTQARQGKFEARFYHKIFEDEVGRVRGHFGPLNTIAVHPKGTGYASGGEDGYVRVHKFDPGYFDFMYEVERERQRAAL